MRIIGGKLKGLHLQAPAHLPVRPTTDMAKEALFNRLYHRYDFENCRVLDLFSGTGSISIEFASRGAHQITSVDQHAGCIHWLKSTALKHRLSNIEVQKADVFKYLTQPRQAYTLIFADPPYHLSNIPEIAQLVFSQNWLEEGGLLIIEHATLLKLDHIAGFTETRTYGQSSFSFFEHSLS